MITRKCKHNQRRKYFPFIKSAERKRQSETRQMFKSNEKRQKSTYFSEKLRLGTCSLLSRVLTSTSSVILSTRNIENQLQRQHTQTFSAHRTTHDGTENERQRAGVFES